MAKAATATAAGSARASARARIETNCRAKSHRACQGSARASARARIETGLSCDWLDFSRVAPAPRRGRGLKLVGDFGRLEVGRVAPAPRRGRGLKRQVVHDATDRHQRSARASARARIETKRVCDIPAPLVVAPAPRRGRGLKPVVRLYPPVPSEVAPAPRRGRGLKQRDPVAGGKSHG